VFTSDLTNHRVAKAMENKGMFFKSTIPQHCCWSLLFY